MTSNAAVAMAIASAPAATLFSPRPLPVAGRTIPVGRGVAAPPSTAFDSDVGVVSAAAMLAVGLAVCAAGFANRPEPASLLQLKRDGGSVMLFSNLLTGLGRTIQKN